MKVQDMKTIVRKTQAQKKNAKENISKITAMIVRLEKEKDDLESIVENAGEYLEECSTAIDYLKAAVECIDVEYLRRI